MGSCNTWQTCCNSTPQGSRSEAVQTPPPYHTHILCLQGGADLPQTVHPSQPSSSQGVCHWLYSSLLRSHYTYNTLQVASLTSAAAPQLHPFQLLFPDCVSFSCCSLIVSTCDYPHTVLSMVSSEVVFVHMFRYSTLGCCSGFHGNVSVKARIP